MPHLVRLTNNLLSSCNRRPDIATKHINIYIANNNLAHARLGVKIFKSAIGLAVVRNLVRRRIFAYFCETTNIKSIDIILIISKKIYSKKNEISDILMQEWKQSLKSSKKFY